jgi:hypothetical protein
MWWLPQVIGLGAALAGSAMSWGVAALLLGLYATQGCFGGDPAYGTRCPSGHYIEQAMWLYVIPALLWAGCWLFPHKLQWRPVRIAAQVAAAMTAIAIPAIAAMAAFDHMSTFTGI